MESEKVEELEILEAKILHSKSWIVRALEIPGIWDSWNWSVMQWLRIALPCSLKVLRFGKSCNDLPFCLQELEILRTGHVVSHVVTHCIRYYAQKTSNLRYLEVIPPII